MAIKEGYRWQRRRWAPNARQQAILEAIVQGKTNAAIGALVGMTVDGVKWYVSELLQETGLSNRRELASWWTRRDRNIIEIPFHGPTMVLESEATNQVWSSADEAGHQLSGSEPK